MTLATPIRRRIVACQGSDKGSPVFKLECGHLRSLLWRDAHRVHKGRVTRIKSTRCPVCENQKP